MAASGCGYSSGELYRSDIRTVAVDIFETKEFRRDLEFQLTEAVKKRISMDTPYKVASREKADTILKGEVLEERQASFAPDYLTRMPRDRQMNMVVRMQWKDLRSGAMLVDSPILIEATDFLPPAGESEGYARQKVMDRVARKIVSKMYSDW